MTNFSDQPTLGARHGPILGISPWAMLIRAGICRVAAHASNTLITGPSGTGKELVARAIHGLSPRAGKLFIPVDCAAVTLYAAVKTGYDTSGLPKIALLVRRPSGTWDSLYQVDTKHTRGIVVLNEVEDRLFVVHRNSDSSGPIVYRESAISSIEFGPRQTLISSFSLKNVSSTKQNFSHEVALIAAGSGTLAGVLLDVSPGENQAPSVDAGTVTVEETPSLITQSFQNGSGGYQGTLDTRIRSDMPTRIFGSSKKLEVDGKPDFSTLIRWDISSLPVNAAILSATITVHSVATSERCV